MIHAHNSAEQLGCALGQARQLGGANGSRRRIDIGIETLQKAALAAGFVMATPDDEPLRDVTYADAAEEAWQPAAGRWLVPLADVPPQRTSARDAMAAAAAWVRDHLPTMMGGRAPA